MKNSKGVNNNNNNNNKKKKRKEKEKAIHSREDIDRKRGNRLATIEDYVEASIQVPEKYIKLIKERPSTVTEMVR